MVAYVVCAHHRREDEARALAEEVGAAVELDDGSRGELPNHDAAWRAAAGLADRQGDDWCVVLEDDALPVPDFDRHVQAAIDHMPTLGLLGLYVGLSRPPQWQARIERAYTEADAVEAGWMKCTHLLWGVGVAMPTAIVRTVLEGVRSNELPYDERLGWWARRHNWPVYYPSYSLVDHADWPTLIRHADGQPRVEPRIAWRIGEPRLNRRYVDL